MRHLPSTSSASGPIRTKTIKQHARTCFASKVAGLTIVVILSYQQFRMLYQLPIMADLQDQSLYTKFTEGRNRKKSNTTSQNQFLNKTHNSRRSRSPLGCAEIAGLKIVRKLGKGKLKQTFIVKLPWGEHAVAKRCMSYSCYKRNMIQEEAGIFKKLHNQYGDEGALKFYGECYIPFVDFPYGYEYNFQKDKTALRKLLEQNIKNFSVGFTSLLELGEPLLTRNEITFKIEKGCFASFFTPQDIKDLKNIARRYANFSDFPLLLRKHGNSYTDNDNPNQYIARIGGGQRGGEGTIHHSDLDRAFLCSKENKLCTVDRALKINCDVISKMLNLSSLDCSFPSPSDTTSNDVSMTKASSPFVSVDTPSYSDRINSTFALEQCLAEYNL